MLIQVCDRCGRKTKNKPTFFLASEKDTSGYRINGVWVGNPVTLCNNCFVEFDNFRVEHERFNAILAEEDDLVEL